MSPSSTPTADVLIIGGGYAGLAAASTLYRATHSTIVFDSGLFRDDKAPHVRLLPGWDGTVSSKYRQAARAELENTGLCFFVNAQVTTIAKQQGQDYEWRVTASNGQEYHGRKVVLATGTDEIYPDIPGYKDCWVTGIFPCMFQFGYEERGCASAGILVVDKLASVLPQVVKLAGDTRKFAPQVVLYTNGKEKVTAQLQELIKEVDYLSIEARNIQGLRKGPERAEVTVELEGGDERKEGFLVHQPWTQLRGTLPAQLGVETTPMGDIRVEHPFPATSVPGVYAAGDCASPFKNASMAIAAGVCAGNGVARELPASI
ncbi:FAD/NAD(P)-binding domain-containing protein [Aspergillus novofumigatus IBT 16806]|uniref:FAD/NAD(P)-binding domain-containing protein n=1 Tax=Aspergillus novofumigatus (strain IBT 16806) TaxID=1392255 RepID=A0A2I1BSW3_ASPN1|nr:FAD/NAD(P)-binding domain-containing protein [Aspergillus novofumigatus IBT 16806]PKX88424.1 FAD/NAD(P)-binding domain-containing protein [Aspergillus novofumigatus IBT 16806]